MIRTRTLPRIFVLSQISTYHEFHFDCFFELTLRSLLSDCLFFGLLIVNLYAFRLMIYYGICSCCCLFDCHITISSNWFQTTGHEMKACSIPGRRSSKAQSVHSGFLRFLAAQTCHQAITIRADKNSVINTVNYRAYMCHRLF